MEFNWTWCDSMRWSRSLKLLLFIDFQSQFHSQINLYATFMLVLTRNRCPPNKQLQFFVCLCMCKQYNRCMHKCLSFSYKFVLLFYNFYFSNGCQIKTKDTISWLAMKSNGKHNNNKTNNKMWRKHRKCQSTFIYTQWNE